MDFVTKRALYALGLKGNQGIANLAHPQLAVSTAYLVTARGGGHSLIWPIRGRAA